MRKEDIERINRVAKVVKAAEESGAEITADTYAGMDTEDRVIFNKMVSYNQDITLREVRAKICSSHGKEMMTVKGLRRIGVLVAARNVHDCRMEVYSNGFAVYRNASHETVLRMEFVGKERYEGDPEVGIKNKTYCLDDYGWGNAVMFSGEERIEEGYADKYEKTMLSMTGTGYCDEDGEETDMELDAGVDVQAEVEQKEEEETLFACLTEKQREAAKMFYLEGYSARAIARKLGLSKDSVQDRLKSSEKKLKKHFRDTPQN